MKTTLTTLLLSALFLVGCTDDSSFLTSPETQISQQSNSPNWVKLPTDLGQGFSVETEYSASKLIKGKDGGEIKLNVLIHQHGNEFGDHFKFEAKVKVEKHSFPDDEKRLFTIAFDPDNTYMNITPSPNTLTKHIQIKWKIEGIDVSQINPDTFSFIYVGDNNEVLSTTSQQLKIDYNHNKIEVVKAEIIAPTDQTPYGTRYGFAR